VADYTETDLTAIRTARLRGIRTVQYADRTVTYSSDAEMRQVGRTSCATWLPTHRPAPRPSRGSGNP